MAAPSSIAKWLTQRYRWGGLRRIVTISTVMIAATMTAVVAQAGASTGIQVEMTISLGNLLTILAFLIGGVGFVYTIRSDVRAQGDRLDAVEHELQKLSDILIALGRQDERLNAMDRRIDDMRRGEGFIVPPVKRG